MKSQLNLLLISMLLAVFAACDPILYGTIQVSNYTIDTLHVQYVKKAFEQDSNITIAPNETKILFDFHTKGIPDEFNCCACEFETLKIYPGDTSRSPALEISDANNWDIKEKTTAEKLLVNCLLKIENDDIQ